MGRIGIIGPLAALCALASSCVSANLSAVHALEEPSSVQNLIPGKADLEICLERLGAPLLVRENDDGAVLAWGWREERGWGLSLSVPLDNQNASFSYDSGRVGLDGLVLFFDDSWTLTGVRRGALRELLPSTQERAQLVE